MFRFLTKNKGFRYFLIFAALLAAVYGAGRLYFQVTGGFLLSNIAYEVPFDPRWETTPLDTAKSEHLNNILAQPFRYLGKGCQSYVFASDDGEYVIKFFKYQRFRPQEWLSYFSFIPAVDQYRLRKIDKKKGKLEGVFTSWKIADESLQPETGVVYAHINQGGGFDKELVIYDKIGLRHSVDLNATQFLVQKRAAMLCPTLDALVKEGRHKDAETILAALVDMLVSEYARGFADNDHALMQNTGVLDGKPVHIDVGQFVYNPIVQNPDVYHQEIFNKTYKFRVWLQEHHPELAKYLEGRLSKTIGDKFHAMQPVFYTADMARIPNA